MLKHACCTVHHHEHAKITAIDKKDVTDSCVNLVTKDLRTYNFVEKEFINVVQTVSTILKDKQRSGN